MRITGHGRDLINAITEEYQADATRADAKKAISRYIKAPLTNNQYSAVISYIMRCGIDKFRKSKLLKCINQSQSHWSYMVKAADHFYDHIYSIDETGKRKPDEYLVFHSQWERDVFLMPEQIKPSSRRQGK